MFLQDTQIGLLRSSRLYLGTAPHLPDAHRMSSALSGPLPAQGIPHSSDTYGTDELSENSDIGTSGEDSSDIVSETYCVGNQPRRRHGYIVYVGGINYLSR